MSSAISRWKIGPISTPNLYWGDSAGHQRACKTCGVVFLTGERSGFCCGPRGDRFALIPPLPDLPREYDAFINDPNISRLSRRLNLNFSFAALESSHTYPTPGFPSFFAISGRIYHRIRNNPNANTAIRWVLYDGFDTASAPHSNSIPEEWISTLRECLLRVNSLARSIYYMHELQRDNPGQFTGAAVIVSDKGSPEIAAIIRTDNTTLSESLDRSLVVTRRDGSDQNIHALSRLWEPLAYPLLFPSGTLGWGLVGSAENPAEEYIGTNFERATTQIWHYRARILREPRFQIFGRLANEYVVDMFTRELESRLNYIRTNQTRLRSMENDAALMGEENVDESENIYLPASFLGSRRWVSNQIADSLAIAAAYGPPTFFITFTCNSDWPEIRSRLRPGQNFTDIPAVVCRVFKRKLAKLMSTLRTMFPETGPPQYSITSIEFQKRGLPHAHILIKYKHECLRSEDIDEVISAVVPEDPADAELVKKFMVHPSHPQDVINHIPPDNTHPLKYCERWKNNARICRFGYPKPITPETTINDNGRVQYVRRETQDENIVPHCLPLLRKFKCHMNMEVGGSGQLFQYLFKYIHKGPDRAHFRISTQEDGERIDEIDEFWNARYHSATEATWRILGYHITKKTPSVTSLAVHLPGSFHRRKYTTRSGKESLSALERYFLRPDGVFKWEGTVRHFDDLLYSEYYKIFRTESYDFGKAQKHPEWFQERPPPRNTPTNHVILRDPNNPHITRLQPIRLSLGDVFYLRSLLQIRPCRSFEELRTVNGCMYPSFQDACITLGLFSDETEAEICFTEAVEFFRTPFEMRLLLIHMLTNDCIATPIDIWQKFKQSFSEDFYCSNGRNWDTAFTMALLEISQNLREHGKTPHDYGLPALEHPGSEVIAELQRWSQSAPQFLSDVHYAITLFNAEQRQIFDTVCDAIQHGQPLSIFIDGKAGRGKTFLVNALCSYVRGNGGIVLAAASSAFAAQLYPGGRTVHSTFKVPVNERNEMLESSISLTDSRAQLIRQASLIIWDEAPMANRSVLACVDEICRQIMGSDLPFGGKVALLLGDFRQTCPVVRKGSKADVVNASITRSTLWPSLSIYRLTHPIRNAEDPLFSDFVDAIGDGMGTEISLEGLQHAHSAAELGQVVFPEDVLNNPFQCLQRSILAPTNAQVDSYNSTIINRLPGSSVLFCAADSLEEHANVLEESESDVLPSPDAILDYVAKIRPNGMPDYLLKIKLGGIYRLLRNFSVDRGLVKNARVVITGIGRKLITVHRLTSFGNGSISNRTDILLPRITFKDTLPSGHTLLRKQFPLAPAYASTFHSCQGLTLDYIGVDLTKPVFTHGQLYTALSRVRNRHNLIVLLPENQMTTKNVTYHEVLI